MSREDPDSVAEEEGADAAGNLDCGLRYATGPWSVPASTLPGARRDPVTEALGRSHGGLKTTVHIRAEGRGQLMWFVAATVLLPE